MGVRVWPTHPPEGQVGAGAALSRDQDAPVPQLVHTVLCRPVGTLCLAARPRRTGPVAGRGPAAPAHTPAGHTWPRCLAPGCLGWGRDEVGRGRRRAEPCPFSVRRKVGLCRLRHSRVPGGPAVHGCSGVLSHSLACLTGSAGGGRCPGCGRRSAYFLASLRF